VYAAINVYAAVQMCTIYICINIVLYLHLSTNILHANINTCKDIHVRDLGLTTYTYVYVCISPYIYIYIYIYVYTYIHIYAQMHVYAYVHMYVI